jgi:hypothetical protein
MPRPARRGPNRAQARTFYGARQKNADADAPASTTL